MKNLNQRELDRKVWLMLINQELELAFESIASLELQIKVRKHKLIELKKKKPFWFQKRKIDNYYEEITSLEKTITFYYNELNHELKNVYRLDILKKRL